MVMPQGSWSLRLACLAVVSKLAAGMPSECNGVDTAPWTSETNEMKGYHVLCIKDSSATCDTSSGESGSCPAAGQVAVSACWGGSRKLCEEFNMPQPEEFIALEEAVIARRDLSNPSRHDRVKKALDKKGKWTGLFAFFSVSDRERTPTKIKVTAALSGLVLVFEGGQFIWPGIEVGFQRNVSLNDGSEEELHLEVITRSIKPLIVEVSRFFTPPECQHIINKAMPHVARSAVSHMDHDVGKPDTNWRSSSTYFMPSDDETLKRLDKRVSALTLTRVSQQEYAQVLRYNVGERYAAHHDYFDPKMYAKNEDIQTMTKRGLFNRMATVFFYLTSVDEGGHTNFPRAGGLPQPRSFEDCSKGVSIAPEEGRIIIFYSQDAAGGLDEYSLHGGCAVRKGTKWSANKWIWSKKMDFLRD